MENQMGTTDEMVDGETMPTEDTAVAWGDEASDGVSHLSPLAQEIPYQIIADFHKASYAWDAAVEAFDATLRPGMLSEPLLISDGENLAAETRGAIYRDDGAFEDDEIPDAQFLTNVVVNATNELSGMTTVVRGMTGRVIDVATKKAVSEEGA